MNPNYEAGYYVTLTKLGLYQAAEAHLEKCAAAAGMEKEAFKRQIANFFAKLIGKGGTVPGTEVAKTINPRWENIKSILSGKGRIVQPPKPSTGGITSRAQSWEAAGGYSPTRAVPPKPQAPAPGPSTVATPPPAPAPSAAEAAAWPLRRKLKWGLGLGGAGLLSYNLLGEKPSTGAGGPQQMYSDPYAEQQYYGY